MDWFKKNPFMGGLALLTALASGAALYFVSSASSELTLQKDDYAAKTSSLRRLQDAKPFPDSEALGLAQKESAKAATVLKDLADAVASQIAPVDTSLTPQGFQDKVSAASLALQEKAAARGALLPEDFYLGFENYRSQPPSPAAAPLLGQQLESINEVLGLLIDAGVKSIVALNRPPLAAESSNEEPAAEQSKDGLNLASFDLEFTCEQSEFRQALGAIVSAKPLIVVTLLAVANSKPEAPAKETSTAESDSAQNTSADAAQIPVLFGQETVNVKMRLASPSGTPAPKDK